MNKGRAEIVSLARDWIGTPNHHRASCKGAGADCLGLVRGVWRDTVGAEPIALPDYGTSWPYSGQGERLWLVLTNHFVERSKDDFEDGSVLLFRLHRLSAASHLGIVSRSKGSPAFIHSYGPHGVVESPLNPAWKRRIVACFDFPERST